MLWEIGEDVVNNNGRPKMHVWPFEGTPHPVGKRHEKAPKGNTHWEGSEFVIADTNYKQGK